MPPFTLLFNMVQRVKSHLEIGSSANLAVAVGLLTAVIALVVAAMSLIPREDDAATSSWTLSVYDDLSMNFSDNFSATNNANSFTVAANQQSKSQGHGPKPKSVPKKAKVTSVYRRHITPRKSRQTSGMANEYVDDLLSRKCRPSELAKDPKRIRKLRERTGNGTTNYNTIIDSTADDSAYNKKILVPIILLIILLLLLLAYLLYKELTKEPELAWYEEIDTWCWALFALMLLGFFGGTDTGKHIFKRFIVAVKGAAGYGEMSTEEREAAAARQETEDAEAKAAREAAEKEEAAQAKAEKKEKDDAEWKRQKKKNTEGKKYAL